MEIVRPLSYSFVLALKGSRIVGAFLGKIEQTILRLFSPCVLGHGEMLRARDEEGHLTLQCMDCWQATRVLEHTALRGPEHRAAEVKGAPVVEVKRLALKKPAYPRPA